MKRHGFRIDVIALGLGMIWVSGLQTVYAGGDAKESPAKAGAAGEAGGGGKSGSIAPAAAAGKHSAPAPHAPAVHQDNANATQRENVAGGAGSGTGLTGSELTGSELTGSELTGSQLTGFGVGFEGPTFVRPPVLLVPEPSAVGGVGRLPSPADDGRAASPPGEVSASAGESAAGSPRYGGADARLRSAQGEYDAALVRVRVRLNQDVTYRQARAGGVGDGSTPTTLPSAEGGSAEAAIRVAEMESKAVAADPEANAARQKLDEAVLARNNAERARAEPQATVSGSSRD